MKNLFFGFWDSNTHIDNIQMKQIIMWAKSILFFNPNVEIKLYTKRNIIRENLINIEKMEIVYVNNFEELLTNTPLEGYTINKNISKPELSDIIRLCLLYKYGGTWLDIDDIVVRKFPKKKNILELFCSIIIKIKQIIGVQRLI